MVENEKYDNTFISFVCTYIKYLLTKDYEKEENKDKKLFIKELVKFNSDISNYVPSVLKDEIETKLKERL